MFSILLAVSAGVILGAIAVCILAYWLIMKWS